MYSEESIHELIEQSPYISRDLSWLKFNYRVLDQTKKPGRTIFDKLKFLAITSSNLDEFFIIRVGSLYNYLDYGKQRIDYSGLREIPFRKKLFGEAQSFCAAQYSTYENEMKPEFSKNGFNILGMSELGPKETQKAVVFFKKTIFPMLTPMTYDGLHTFPLIMNKVLTLAVTTNASLEKKEKSKISFVQIPQNLPRFFEVTQKDRLIFVPIEDIICSQIDTLFRNVNIISKDLMRITRNGDFTLDESDDIEANFIEEVRSKLKTRRTGRVVRVEVGEDFNRQVLRMLKARWDIDDANIFKVPKGVPIDFTGLHQIAGHPEFSERQQTLPVPGRPLQLKDVEDENIFNALKKKDVLLHLPYHSISPVLELLEASAEDPNVLSIKITIYRLADDSRITSALLKAAENGKHVSVLFEVKARFDEENNIREAKRLERAGCFVIYGISDLKTHTKLMLIVRKEGKKVTRYVHLSSGNYNEKTSRLYTDMGLLTTNDVYGHDVSEFFNAITGHSRPNNYKYLITAPGDMRDKLIELIRKEAENARNGVSSGILIKINSLQDDIIINELYAASQAGVPIKLIVRGMCCLKPGKAGLSENISVRSIVGNLLEHSRILYFHNGGESKIYGGSADFMVRSFERRIESLYLIVDPQLKRQIITVMDYNLRDNVNSYSMQPDGNYVAIHSGKAKPFDLHKELYKLKEAKDVNLFPDVKLNERAQA